jgi:parallel beta-helix repeat protein
MPRYGISLKSFDSDRYSHNNTVEFNEIIDTNLETNDTGAIETLGRDRQASGNIIRFNFIRNVVGMGTTKEGKILSPYNTWGIYLDDYSSNTIVYGNIVVGTVLGAIRINGGKDNLVDNNIFVDGAKNQIQLSPKEDLMTGNLIYRNIIISQQPEAKLWDSTTKWQPNILKNSDFNLYWHTGGLNIEKTKQAITPEGNFKQWQAAGFDTHSLVTEPPFLTPLKQDNNQICKEDFKLDRHSDVFKQLGLKPIPIERIGIQGFQL